MTTRFETFCTWHARVRKERGFTQKQIAEQLGWQGLQYISNIERGLCTLPKDKIKKVAKIYKVSDTFVAMLVLGDIKKTYLEYLKKN